MRDSHDNQLAYRNRRYSDVGGRHPTRTAVLFPSIFDSKKGLQVTMYDVGVIAAGAAAVTQHWWTPLLEWLPDFAKICITAATVVFVIARAAYEVRRFWRDRAETQDDA